MLKSFQTYEVLAEKLEKAGVHVDFCSSWTNLDYLSFPSYPEFRDIASSRSNRKRMKESVAKADVVICSDSAAVVWILAECLRQGKRSLWGLHTDLFNRSEVDSIPPILIRLLFILGSYLSDVTFTTSYIFKRKLKEVGFEVNFVMDQDFKCDEFKVNDNRDDIMKLRQEMLCCNTDYIALYAGRLSKEKRINLLLKALPDNVTLLIIGDGPEKDNILELQNKYSNVKVIPKMISQAELRLYYKAADIHVSASNSETYGMTVRESLYCRTPVVVQNDGGFIEQVRDSIDGFLVDFKDSKAAKDKIHQACKMINNFNPMPQNNNVVELSEFIVNARYETIPPYSRTKNRITLFFFTKCLPSIYVFCYYCVSFLLKIFGIRAEM